MRLFIIFLPLLLLLACGGEAVPEAEDGAAVIELVGELPPRVELPAELKGALAGKRVVLLVGDGFYDPELYDVRRLFAEAGAEVYLASDRLRIAGIGGSVPLVDLDYRELARMDGIALLYLMQSRGMEGMTYLAETGAAVGRVLDGGGYVGASGISSLVFLQNERARGVRMAVFKGQQRKMREAGALVADDDVALDGRIGTCEFWPQGSRLALELILALAAE